MQHWNLGQIETPDGSRSPVVLHSREGERRVVLIGLEPGQSLDEHQVKESALLLVVDGSVRVEAGDESIDARPGELFRFDPDERHSVSAKGGAAAPAARAVARRGSLPRSGVALRRQRFLAELFPDAASAFRCQRWWVKRSIT
ncbi:MAG TPA: cupin domain-containing protein [Gaiellaceae bacterium]|nr:cupin domain-containing protein [Gaiellaceae bacterium]